MQILKDPTTGLLFSPFAIGNVWRLQVSVLVHFALDKPDTPLPEQELWQDCQKALGAGCVLDPGFPKPGGELLLAGAWHAPGGTRAGGGSVRFQTGPIVRRLAVFGPRHWQAGPLGPRPSQPGEVDCVPLTWEMAFGGEGLAENPAGLGMTPVTMPWGEVRHPLPQVEDLATGLVTSPGDRPRPACPLPLRADAPSRLALAGTYDARWQAEDWPGFPADVAPDFFRLAAPSQRLAPDYGRDDAALGTRQGFFQGGEDIVLENLHPARPLLTGRLPKKRVRVFATRRQEAPRIGRTQFDGQPPEPGLFEEVWARLETVWLFPGLERGLALYRAVLPTLDDEASDIVRLFPVVEDQGAAATDIAFWHAEEARRLAELAPGTPAQPNPAPKINALLAEAQDLVRTIEEDVNLAFDRTAGLAPSLPPPDARLLTRARALGDSALQGLDQARARLGELRRQFGHLVKIDARPLDTLRSSVSDLLGGRLGKAERKLNGFGRAMAFVQRKQAETLARQADELANLPTREMREALAAYVAQGGEVAPRQALPQEIWSSSCLHLLADHALTRSDHPQAGAVVTALLGTGLRRSDLDNALLGLLPEEIVLDPVDFGPLLQDGLAGIERERITPEGRLRLPAGLVVPFFEKDRCVALTIRPLGGPAAQGGSGEDVRADDLFLPCPVFTLPGSGQGMQLVGAIRPKPVLLATDPLAAWLLYAKAGDRCAILLATHEEAPVPDDLKESLGTAPCLLWPVPPLPASGPGSGPGPFPGEGQAVFAPRSPAFGRAEHPQAPPEDLLLHWRGLAGLAQETGQPCEPLPWPAEHAAPHLAGAGRRGLDLRRWLEEELAARLGKARATAVTEGAAGEGEAASAGDGPAFRVPRVDARGINERLRARGEALTAEIRQEVEGTLRTGLADVQAERARHGLEPMKHADELFLDVPTRPATEPDQRVLAYLDNLEGDLAGRGLQKDVARVQRLRRHYVGGMEKAAALEAEGMARLAQDAGPDIVPPAWVDRVPGARALLQPAKASPDDMLDRLARGETGLFLRDLDLAGRDLSGLSLTGCVLENVSLAGANLTGTIWDKVVATRVDFGRATLERATLGLCSFDDCTWQDVQACNMQAELCQWKKGLWKDVQLAGAHLKLASFTSVAMQGLIEGGFLELATISEGRLEELRLHGTRLVRCSLARMAIRDLVVDGGVWEATGLATCTGSGLVLRDVDARNLRFLVQCELAGVRCERCRLDELCCREVSLPGMVLAGCSLDGACLDRCDLVRANLAGCRARAAQIRHCDLEEADLRSFSLPTGSLRKSRLVRADLTRANLYAADLYKVVLGDTILDGANLTGTLLQGRQDLVRSLEKEAKR